VDLGNESRGPAAIPAIAMIGIPRFRVIVSTMHANGANMKQVSV
jgi:hypothetical protein